MKRQFIIYIIGFFLLNACQSKKEKSPQKIIQKLNLEQANNLIKLPLKCVNKEFPNKPGEIINSAKDIERPRVSHPAFYGCFDWHSSVHGHWSMVKLVKDFPNLKNREAIIALLKSDLSKRNIELEVKYFNKEQDIAFERTYGWAWLLKLALEIKSWDDPDAKILDQNLQPLTDLIVDRYINYLPKQNYPIRYGTHANTAFGLVFAYDYAKYTQNDLFLTAVKLSARKLFLKDKNYSLNWEPSGTDFLSPALEEIDIMRRVLSKDDFLDWLQVFCPQFLKRDFDWNPAVVTDRKDGYLVHLDGLNFSRAWVLYGLCKQFPEPFKHLEAVADKQMNASLDHLTSENYEGEHWLASFAIYSLSQK